MLRRVLPAFWKLRSRLEDFRKTAAQGLMHEEDPEEDVCVKVFTDASFSPEGGESHGGFLVFINRCLIFWRSGRQPTITLSTAESNLNELIEGMTGGEALAVILYELCGGVKRQAWTDSQSAASIMVNEGGNWRTRHLKTCRIRSPTSDAR